MTDWDDETSVTEESDASPISQGEAHRPVLVVLTGTSLGAVFHLPPGSSVIGRAKEANVLIVDEGVSRAHARIYRDDDGITLEDLDSRNGTFLNGLGVEGPTRLADDDRIQLGHATILQFSYLDALEDHLQCHLHQSAIRDGLTRLYNKRYFRERLATELRFALRHRQDLALLLLDLDHFKRVNDTYGHLGGDRVLVAVADALTQALRAEDVLARYGGEELAVLLRGIALPSARHTAERLRRVIEALEVTNEDGRTIHATVSIGVASFPMSGVSTADALIEAADQSLYAAKRSGRNRVGP